MKILELYSGTQSLSRAARARGHECTTLDKDSRHSPTICEDVLKWNYTTLPRDAFDFIFCGCPCETYSQARSKAKISREDAMKAADKIIARTIHILDYFDADFCIENPRFSLLWGRDVARPWAELHISLTSMCRYGFLYRKHTRFASTFPMRLAPPCGGDCQAMIGKCHQQWAQKGPGGLTDITHTTDELHRIPESLCDDILSAVENVRQARRSVYQRIDKASRRSDDVSHVASLPGGD